jgi:endonuclease YncB( thermonuclease family)
VPARVVSLRSGETLEISDGKRREIVHLACLDAPETVHKYPQLGWFGRATLSAVELAVPPGAHVCLTEQSPPKRDGEGHRVVYVTLADGRDYTQEVIAGGLGLLRPAHCARAAHYREIEDHAIAKQRGLWGGMAAEPAFAAGRLALSVAGGPPPPRRSGGGGRG